MERTTWLSSKVSYPCPTNTTAGSLHSFYYQDTSKGEGKVAKNSPGLANTLYVFTHVVGGLTKPGLAPGLAFGRGPVATLQSSG